MSTSTSRKNQGSFGEQLMKSNKTIARLTQYSTGEKRALLSAAAMLVGIIVVLGWSFAPSSASSTVNAANQEVQGGATTEMLAYALNFKSASNLGVFGGNSVTDEDSDIRGLVSSAGDIAGVSSSALSVGDPSEARRDLLDAISAVDQLPCTQLNDANLGGQTFMPGVYCIGSAVLAGRMTVDANGDANSRFVFRVDGTFMAENSSIIERTGGAAATNVYIFARDTANIGSKSTIGANVISRDSVRVGRGSTVAGKVIGVNGDVTTNSNIVAAGTGYIEICKNLFPNDPIPTGTIFNFTVSGVTGQIQVPAGGCSSVILVASGNVTVTEVIRANTAVVGIDIAPVNRLVSSSFALQQVVVAVPDGDVSNQTVVTFTNQTTRTGTIEICKYGNDSDVTGFFNFTAQGAPGQTLSVPVGFCLGPVTLTILQVNNPSPSPTQAFTANITEIGQPTFRLEDVQTFPTNRLTAPFTPDQGFNATGTPISNPGGGYANITLVAGGGASSQTTVRFYNRSIPGRIKVCKITSDPINLPVGTSFRFTVYGLAPTSPTQVMPGVPTQTTVDVIAGPASQNGFCNFVAGTWVIGSPVNVVENGLSPGQTLPAGITAAMIRTSRIRASTAFSSTPVTVPGFPGNPVTTNPDIVLNNAVVPARNATTEIEYTDFIYRPAILKLCKVAGTGVTTGTPFAFNLAAVDPLTTWPISSASITIPAGFCTFINGPFPADPSFPGVGLFNFNTSLVITEGSAGTTVVSAIASSTGGPLVIDLTNRKGTITLNQSLTQGQFNELSFTNSIALAPPAARFDFDGDKSSDVALFRPSDGNWWFLPSSTGNVGYRAIHFGQAGDVPVAADYDGDGTTDAAVYRSGQWHILGSSAGYSTAFFGIATDIPQAGDYDGDGKADLAVYRPSNGTWYIMGSSTGFRAVQFGIPTDIPVAADFDGDGKMDPAVYRNGIWYINGSSSGFSGAQFGIPTDIPVQADYDGDRKADLAVYRNGTWHILGSATGYWPVQFGISTDTPVPADYDGDGKTDIAVFRSSTQYWHILKSSQSVAPGGGYSFVQCGSTGDMIFRY